MVPHSDIKILLVDHDPGFLGELQFIFHSVGYTHVHQAHTGREAEVMFHTLKPDVTVLDIAMPHLEGFQCLKYILTKNPRAHVVVATAMQPETVQSFLYFPGNMAHVSKKVTIPMLRQEILTLMEIFSRKEGWPWPKRWNSMQNAALSYDGYQPCRSL